MSIRYVTRYVLIIFIFVIISFSLLFSEQSEHYNIGINTTPDTLTVEQGIIHLGNDEGNQGITFSKNFTISDSQYSDLKYATLNMDFIPDYGPFYEDPPILFINDEFIGSILPFFPPIGVGCWNYWSDGTHDYCGFMHVSINIPRNILKSGDNTFRIDNGAPDDDYRFTNVKVVIFYTSILNPKEKDVWIAGEQDTIKWEGIDEEVSLDIEYSTDDGSNWQQIASEILASDKKYGWDIPEEILSNKCLILLRDNATNDIMAMSDRFKIKPYIITKIDPITGNYIAYDIKKDRWGFGNTKEEMWPVWWWLRFNYISNKDPFSGKPYPQNICDSIFAKTKFSDRPDWVSFVNAFGIDACYIHPALRIYRTPALQYWKAIKKNWGGSCFGIAISNALEFEKETEFQNKYPNFPKMSPYLVGSDSSVIPVTMELFTKQFGNPHQQLKNNVLIHKTPKQTISDMKEILREDEVQISTLSMISNSTDPNNQGGHAINVYKLEQDKDNPELYYVYVWDNSYPDVLNARILVDTSASGGKGVWEPEYGWSGWGGDKWFYLRDPANQYLTNVTLPKEQTAQSVFLLDENELEIYNNGDNYLVIKDNEGNKTGFNSNGVTTDIPYSVPLMAEDGGFHPPFGYYLPNNNYSVELSNFSNDTVNTFFFNGNKSFEYERYGATQTQTDRLFFEGGVTVSNPDQQQKSIKLQYVITDPSSVDDKLFSIKSLALTENDSVKIVNPDDNKLDLISFGTEKNYQIDLEYVTDIISSRFSHSKINLTENTTHKLVPNWGDFADLFLTIYVDKGNDGTIDDTIHLENQLTGINEEQGSLIPKEYRLEQNYPNPFNNTTVIRYSIPKEGLVTLKVYSIIGEEVATLVNETKPIGSYEISFNSDNLTSGVYLYKLTSGGFTQTKKMILLK